MKKKLSIFLVIGVLFVSLFSLTACKDKYEEYLGIYDCTYITNNGINYLSSYEYYTIELGKNRNLTARYKLSSSPYTEGESSSKFDIDGEKFYETTALGKNEYKYIDGVIIMEYSQQGINIVAHFEKRA